MASSMTIHWNKAQLNKEIGRSDEVYKGISSATNRFGAAAQAMSAGFHTGTYYDRKTKTRKGPSQAEYDYNVERNGSDRWPVGLVWPANYAAWKDLQENNTLLKAVPHV